MERRSEIEQESVLRHGVLDVPFAVLDTGNAIDRFVLNDRFEANCLHIDQSCVVLHVFAAGVVMWRGLEVVGKQLAEANIAFGRVSNAASVSASARISCQILPTPQFLSGFPPLPSSDAIAVRQRSVVNFSMQEEATRSKDQPVIPEADRAQRLFQCSTCKRSFTRADHLTRHVRARKSFGYIEVTA
jgi:hypothetical protein